jgi:phospholipid/cholesterol/gamma-HCH transport system substrate-binding protein
VAIAAIVVLALLSSVYILSHQRLSWPLDRTYTINAAFTTVVAVAPGLGEPVNVAGVRVGQIAGASARDGRGVLRMEIDPHKLPRIYANAHAVLRPNTPLKDMQVDIDPGAPPAPALASGGTIPVSRTTAPIDADELLRGLDADTRTWLQSLISALDRGTRGRARDLNALLRKLGPTTAQVRRIGDLLASRRRQLAGLVHNLATLTRAAGGKDREIGQVVESGNATFAALASQDAALRASIARLPGTLADAGRTLRDTTTFARAVPPTLDALMPTTRRLSATLRSSRQLLPGITLLPLEQVPPFIAALQPLAPQLPPTISDLSSATPPLTSAFGVLEQVSNEIAYNPPGGSSYLFWLAWFAHNSNSVLSTEDAHGAVFRGLGLVSCSTLSQPGAGAIAGLITATSTCPPTP